MALAMLHEMSADTFATAFGSPNQQIWIYMEILEFTGGCNKQMLNLIFFCGFHNMALAMLPRPPLGLIK